MNDVLRVRRKCPSCHKTSYSSASYTQDESRAAVRNKLADEPCQCPHCGEVDDRGTLPMFPENAAAKATTHCPECGHKFAICICKPLSDREIDLLVDRLPEVPNGSVWTRALSGLRRRGLVDADRVLTEKGLTVADEMVGR